MLQNEQTQNLIECLRENKIQGQEFGRSYADQMDAFLDPLFAQHLRPDICVIATGGYGRAELCPCSDIDLLFLTETDQNEAIESVLYPLWDTGLKIGHGTRNISQTMALVRKDLSTLTALADMRFLWGNEESFSKLHNKIQKHLHKNSKRFIRQKLAERDRRHEKMGDTRYVLEPNIKDGKGGLRDFQTLLWITFEKDIKRLSARNIMTEKEARVFQKAHDFLLTVRCHLHDIAGRAEERLHFDIQKELATRLGYAERDHAKAVERFMKHYFLITRDIGDMTRLICATLEPQKRRPVFAKKHKGFELIGDRITFSKKTDLQKDPLEIMRFFREAQKTGKDLHPAALRLITQNLKQVKNLQQNDKANEIFLEILCSKKDAALILRRMNEAGVLERFIPDFRKVIALMQFDRYHSYTVDEHTIRAIDILHKSENEPEGLPARIWPHIKNRKALYVAMMLHDIAKGRGGDHSEIGAKIARKLGARLGLSNKETGLAAWLVRDHLVMARTAFKRSLEDPQTITDFLQHIPDEEHLNLLALLTLADIKAVGPETWTSWKANLLRTLYELTSAALKGNTISFGTPDWPSDLPHTENHIHIESSETQHITTVTIYVHDRPGLFADLAGALAAAGANVIEARINTLPDGRVIDIFTVNNSRGQAFTKKKRLSDLQKSITSALSGQTAQGTLDRKKATPPPRKDRAFDVGNKININNRASQTHTVIEVQTRDRPGLLYDLACALRDAGCSIDSAKIVTQGLKATDVFYVTKSGEKIKNFEKIKANILNIL